VNQVLIPTGFAPPVPPRGLPLRQLQGATMGTTWSVRCATTIDPARLRAGIVAQLERVTAEMSGWRADSDLCRFNRLPAGASLRLPEGFRRVLACALETAAATDGAFDPTLGALVNLWGFGAQPAETEGPPPETRIAAARACAGWRRISFDAATGEARQPGGLALDLSGIAKGFAVDLVAEWLLAAGVHDCLVEIGGELRGHGVKPDGSPWWVGIEAPPGPRDASPPFVVALHGLAMASSGEYRRCFDHAGRTYGHTLDPLSGQPIDNGVVAVTVLHPSCMQADALATALAVLGPAKALDHARHQGIAALLVLHDRSGSRSEHLSPALAAMLD
jgi:thiamine biosynthesis lipoprotein